MDQTIQTKAKKQHLATKLGMYRIPTVLDNPATFCQIRQFMESDNVNLTKKTHENTTKKVANI